jgi:hypothetical protein
VIAAHNNPAETSGPINDLIGIGAIANNIAEIPDNIVWRRSGKSRFEGRKIRMNV